MQVLIDGCPFVDGVIYPIDDKDKPQTYVDGSTEIPTTLEIHDDDMRYLVWTSVAKRANGKTPKDKVGIHIVFFSDLGAAGAQTSISQDVVVDPARFETYVAEDPVDWDPDCVASLLWVVGVILRTLAAWTAPTKVQAVCCAATGAALWEELPDGLQYESNVISFPGGLQAPMISGPSAATHTR